MPADAATGAKLCPKLATLRLRAALPDLPCGYKGQTGAVYRVEADGSLYCILKCGHAIVIREQDIDRLAEIEWLEPKTSQEREHTMVKKAMKQNKIPNAGGVIQVQGYEDEVKSFVTDYAFYMQLQSRIEEVKERFRKLAQEAEKNAEGSDVTRVEFIAEDGSCIPVSFADVEKESNRTRISDKAYKAALKLGFDIEDLGITQTHETFELTGDWVAWFKGVLQTYEAQGQAASAGFVHKEVVKLSLDGIAKLRKMAREGKTEQERKAAELLLSAGVKASTVSVKR